MLDRTQLLALTISLPLATLALTAASASAAPGNGLDQWTPVDYRDYLATDGQHKGTVFFQTPDGRNCAFFWNNGYAGCDAVPFDAPPGVNQIRSSVIEAGHYVTADHPTFTHPTGAKVLPEGHKVSLANTTCGVGYQGTVTCETGPHGFTVSATYSVTH